MGQCLDECEIQNGEVEAFGQGIYLLAMVLMAALLLEEYHSSGELNLIHSVEHPTQKPQNMDTEDFVN